MPYSADEIKHRLQEGEDSLWEFKEVQFAGQKVKGPKRDDLADEMAAFANADGGALLFSVSDAGRLQPMSREQIDALEFLAIEIAEASIKPPLRIRTHKKLVAGKLALILDIPKGDAQHDSPGGAYLRQGSAKRKLASDEKLRLAQRRSQARYLWFDEQPVPGTGFGTLDEALWKPLLSARAAADPETALEKLGLLAPDDANVLRATVAGILLCTQSPDEHLGNARITATRYRGQDRTSGQVDAQEITGPLDQQVAAGVAFVMRNMQVSAEKMPMREELPQYSDEAVFEALVNAVAHRDYSMRGSAIRLSMFADRLELQSPGALANNLTLDSMATRQATRNQTLASLMGMMPVREIQGSGKRRYFMERRGDGVPAILRETQMLSGRQPEYRLIDDADLLLAIPAAAQESSAARVIVTAWCDGQPAPGVNLLALFPNKTWKQAETDAEGEARLALHTTHLPMMVFAAAPGYAAHSANWLPSAGALALDLQRLPQGGSEIFPEATGHLPGLRGRLTPKLDTHGRAYLYASSIAINKGQPQPVPFLLGETLRLTDAQGAELNIRIVNIQGRAALVEYQAGG